MKTILITGGTGFVGGHLRAYLRQSQPEDKIVLTGHNPQPNPDKQTEVIALDLTDAESVTAMIKKYQPQEVYHLASIAHVARGFEDPAEVLQNNFQVTLNLLEAIRLRAPQTRVLLVSSADLYDHTDQRPIDENRLIKPLNPYAVSKATQDLMGQAYAASFGLKVVIVRPFNHIGPRQRLGFVVADFAHAVALAEVDAKQREIKVGNLESSRDFTSVRDMVRAYALLMERGAAGEIYNAGSERQIKIADLLEMIIDQARVEVKVSVDKKKFRPVDHPIIACNAGKLKSLGWQAEIDLSTTIGDILDYWRAQVATEDQGK